MWLFITEDSHSFKNFAGKPETHGNSKSWNDNITGHSVNLSKSTRAYFAIICIYITNVKKINFSVSDNNK